MKATEKSILPGARGVLSHHRGVVETKIHLGSTFFTTFVLLLTLNLPLVNATEWYVDGSVAVSGDGTSPETAFKTVQQGIDAALNGDTVIVGEGTYYENIQFKGKNIVLTSKDPFDSEIVGNTIIDGNRASSVVTFSGTENENCVLAGFTIRNGKADRGAGICGGASDKPTHATIRNNVITGNATLEWNFSSSRGGGIADCAGSIRNNLIIANDAQRGGGGLVSCDGKIENNTISENRVHGMWGGSGLLSCGGTITNCIIWGNRSAGGAQVHSSSALTYSCIENLSEGGGGKGNISPNPHFVDPENGDFHLRSWSPCIDAGDPASPFSNEPEPNGGRVDMGAYGNTPEATSKSADTDADGLPDDWELNWFGNLEQGGYGDPDGDHFLNNAEYRYARNPTSAAENRVHDATRDRWYITVQEAVSLAYAGDEIVVYPGVYKENIYFDGKNVVLRSTNPSSSEVVSGTVLDGQGIGSVVTFSGTEVESCVLSGFTIRNGRAGEGAGILGSPFDSRTHATIENNTITGNRSDHDGGGLINCGGIIRNNVIAGNSADMGAGLSDCDGTIENNTVAGNTAQYAGGGLANCEGTIINCIIWGNVAPQEAQLYQCSEPTYSCVQDWQGWGEGNISDFPHFVDPRRGDYHLWSWSPCIDAGDPFSDYSNEPEPNGERIDMGAYGNTVEATSVSQDTDEDFLPDDWEMHFFGNLSQGAYDDPDNDEVANIDEYHAGTNPGGTSYFNWCVDGSVPVSGDGTSWGTAFKTIQEGIDASFEGDRVIVARGTYFENIRFKGKNITLTSSDPLDPDVVANTIIDGNKVGSVVTFLGAEDETCVLSSFTIRNGGGSNGAGINGNHTRATIENNVITGNVSRYEAGGLYRCDGMIRGNTITGNSAENGGGGLLSCAGPIQNNTISGNVAGGSGGGLEDCDGPIEGNAIEGNSAGNVGGGLDSCGGTIRNNTICGNSANYSGGGLEACMGTIENNTIAWNVASYEGGGLRSCGGTIFNCIIWGNVAGRDSQLCASSAPTYSCIEDWQEGGEGNISGNPHFVNPAAGDYHLRSWSPCIDAGDPWSDYWNEPEPNGERIDMGAYGNTPEATSASQDTDEDLLPDDWERHFFGNLAQQPSDDPDGDGTSNLEEYRRGTNPARSGPWYADGSVAASGDGTSWATAFKTIREGIDASSDGEKITVAQGIYFENIHFKGKNIKLTGTDPLDSDVVADTIIDGGQRAFVVGFSGMENETCVLSGFTIRNGSAYYGGGICGNGTRAAIEHNVISGSSARYDGGGVYACNGIIQNNIIAGNSAQYSGGGLSSCSVIQNCTIVGNSAEQDGGGLSQSWATIRNCIFWGNTASRNPQLFSWLNPSYSCIQDWEKGGTGNTSAYPYFVDPIAGDYHLQTSSPCIDAGDPTSPYSNEPQPNGGRVDMGAYGNTPEATSKSPDTDADNLPDDWELRWFGDLGENGDGDPDGDTFVNLKEYLYGWDPMVAEPLAENLTTGALYRTIQAAVREANDGHQVVVYPGVYKENINFAGKNIILRSGVRPGATMQAVATLQGDGTGPVVTFSGAEGETCVLSGLTIRNGTVGILGGTSDNPTHATIRNNVIASNSAEGLLHCHGTIQNNTIIGNAGPGLSGCKGTIVNCIIWGNGGGAELLDCSVPTYSCIEGWSGEGQGNIADNPELADTNDGDFRLSPSSPCIDMGENRLWAISCTDIIGMYRPMFGGKSLTMDMGAYEYYINDVRFGPGFDKMALTWTSSLWRINTTYSIFYSDDLVAWHLADGSVPTAGFETTSWIDDGSKTGVPPSLAPRRFYRILENP